MPDAEAICPYCGVGCRLKVTGTPARGVTIRGVDDSPASLGRLCAKGALLGESLETPDRLTQPMIRLAHGDSFRSVDWSTALRYAAECFANILHTYGPESVAFYGSGQLDTETVYLVSKLFKGGLHTNNTDSNSRLCMASAVAGYRSSLGSDGPPCCYEDIDHSDVIFIIGSNMAEAHPVTFDRVREARRRGAFVVVADPRRTRTARECDLHLPVSPGGDIALLNALGKVVIERDLVDAGFIERHTNRFAEYREFLKSQDLALLIEASGIRRESLERLGEKIGTAQAFLSFYSMGLGQSTVGTWKNNSLINLHLLTGQIGKVGAGPFSLTGQPNAMGGREAGLLSHQLPGYRVVDNPEDRRQVEAYWKLPPDSIRPTPGLTAVEMFRALEKGKIKAIWIAGTNPAVSLPDLHQTRRALDKAQLVIVQDAYHPTETTTFAHVLFPAAQWGERDWTSTSSERLVSHSPKLFEPPGEARPDWQIIAGFARELGFGGFDFPDAAAVWDEFARLTAGRPCDMAGISSRRLREQRHVYWPCPHEDHPGSRRRYLDRVFPTPDGRAVFLARDHRSPREETDHEFPFVLTTGRLYTHWHTLTRTAKCDKLVKREPGPFVEIHPQDADRLSIVEGDLVQVSSRRGTIQLPARVSDSVSPGLVFVPFHWGDLYASGNAANYLTIAATDATSKQPELKYCAVSVERVAPVPVRGARVIRPTLASRPVRSPLPVVTT